MRTLIRSVRSLLVTTLVGGVAVGLCLAALAPGLVEVVTAHHYTAETVTELSALDQRTTVFDSAGNVMGYLGLQNREVVSYTQIPKQVVDAVIATEDRTFWTNDGIDLGAVFRAFVANVTSGRIEQGGSTITQQLVKNRILTPKRDVNRKVKELEDAVRLNRKFSKQKILEEYLNTVYFGSGSYGIKSAAERYFLTVDPGATIPRGKRLDELTVGESALLAGLIASPEEDNPFTHPENALRRRHEVLQGELSQGYITQVEMQTADRAPLPTIAPPSELRPTNYLVAEVQQRLLDDPRLGATSKARRDTLLKGGLKVYTTFDPNMQAAAQNAVDTKKPQKGPDWDASLVAIDPTTGAVRAMVGGPDFSDSQYNIATHPIGRQPGSTWKVITLAAAFQNGYSPNDMVDETDPCSVPKVFGNVQTVNAEPGEGLATIWSATAGSVNCAFVRIAASVGDQKLIDMAHRLGITQNRLIPILTLTIGTIEATPLEMATVIGTVADDGIHHSPYFVQKVVAPNGNVLVDESGHPGDRAIDSAVASCEVNVLRGVVTGGTGTAAQLASHTAFGKTGTTDNESDAWFIGATPQLATAVWFGNTKRVVSGAGFGGVSAAPIFKAFMDSALAGQPDVGIPAPGPVCSRPGEFVVPEGGRSSAAPEITLPVGPSPTIVPVPTVKTNPPATTAPRATVPPATSTTRAGGRG